MRALQGAFPRLKTRWPYEERGERDIGLTLIALLYNYQASCMRLNQIRNVYWQNNNSTSVDAGTRSGASEDASSDSDDGNSY
eukprot:scaffold27240_cov154-Amphora_coffeaeformis.AAC.1